MHVVVVGKVAAEPGVLRSRLPSAVMKHRAIREGIPDVAAQVGAGWKGRDHRGERLEGPVGPPRQRRRVACWGEARGLGRPGASCAVEDVACVAAARPALICSGTRSGTLSSSGKLTSALAELNEGPTPISCSAVACSPSLILATNAGSAMHSAARAFVGRHGRVQRFVPLPDGASVGMGPSSAAASESRRRIGGCL